MPLPVCFRDENEKSKFEEVYADINRRTAKSGNLILEICKSHVHCNPVTETRPKRKKRPFLVTSTPRRPSKSTQRRKKRNQHSWAAATTAAQSHSNQPDASAGVSIIAPVEINQSMISHMSTSNRSEEITQNMSDTMVYIWYM